MAIRLVLQFIR